MEIQKEPEYIENLDEVFKSPDISRSLENKKLNKLTQDRKIWKRLESHMPYTLIGRLNK